MRSSDGLSGLTVENTGAEPRTEFTNSAQPRKWPLPCRREATMVATHGSAGRGGGVDGLWKLRFHSPCDDGGSPLDLRGFRTLVVEH